MSEILYSGFTLIYYASRLKNIAEKDVSSTTNNVMKRAFFLQYGKFLKEFLKTQRNLVIIPVFSPIYTRGRGLESKKMAIKQKFLMVNAFNQKFSVSKTQFYTKLFKIWHSILWEFLLFKLPKEIKDAKGNISMHYKTSLTMIRLDLMWQCNMDGRHKTTDTIKKSHLEAPRCAQSLPVRSNFSLEVSLCSNIQVFSVGKPSHITSTRGAGTGQ